MYFQAQLGLSSSFTTCKVCDCGQVYANNNLGEPRAGCTGCAVDCLGSYATLWLTIQATLTMGKFLKFSLPQFPLCEIGIIKILPHNVVMA